jgi:hypothetical protein
VIGLTRKMGMNRKTVHSYAKAFQGDFGHVRDSLVLEVTWLGNPEPHQKVVINSFVGTMMQETNQQKLIEDHQMEPFEVQSQNPTRTICEKIMSLIRFSYSENPIQDLKKKIRHVYDLHLLLENQNHREFIESEDFSNMLHAVATDDIKSYKNDNKWLREHPKKAVIFSQLKDIWKSLETEYIGDFKNLVYGTLPNPSHVLQSMEIIQSRIERIKWEIQLKDGL